MVDSCPFKMPHPMDEDYVEDPYPFLQASRQQAPFVYLDELDMWLVTRYVDVKRILRDPVTFSNSGVQDQVFPVCEEALRILKEGIGISTPQLTSSDAPVHTRLRKHYAEVVSFTPPRLAEITPWIKTRTEQLIDGFKDKGSVNIVSALTTPLPAKVIFRLIGFPEKDTDELLSWCMDRLKWTWSLTSSSEQIKIAEGMVKYWQYCWNFVEASTDAPEDNYASRLLQIHQSDPEKLSFEEVVGLIYGLVFAGQETTANSLASMIRLLLEDRDKWSALCKDTSLVPTAVEECLRLEPPIAAWRRTVSKDTEIAGLAFNKGTKLLLHLGSANHDEATFQDPNNIDLARKNAAAHLAFGYGVHACLGAALARAEARILLDLLLAKLPNLRLSKDQNYHYIANLTLRGPSQLWVQW